MSAVTNEDIAIAWWERAEESAGRHLGSRDLMFALHDMWCDDSFENDQEFALALDLAWTTAEHPAHDLDVYHWCEMFNHLGFLRDGVQSVLPDSIPVLYRAAVNEDVWGLTSWTSDIEVARSFQARIPNSAIWALSNVEPGHYTVRMFSNGRKEQEWVIDTGEMFEPELRLLEAA